MKRLARKNLYTQDNSLEVRIEQLERRIFPQVEYATCTLEDFFGTVAANSGFYIPVTDVFASSSNASNWRIVDGGLHIPNLGDGPDGGGFFHTFCLVTFDVYLGYTVANPFQGGGPTVIQSVWDKDENEIDDSFPAIYRNYSIRYDNVGTDWRYAEHAIWWNDIPNAQSDLGGWHAHFKPSFLNDSALGSRTLLGGSLTVMRYGPVTGQFAVV